MGVIDASVQALLDVFGKGTSLRLDAFASCWKRLKFGQVHHVVEVCACSNLTRGKVEATSRQVLRDLYASLIRFILIPRPIYRRVGSLYALLVAFETQAITPKEPIQVSPHALAAITQLCNTPKSVLGVPVHRDCCLVLQKLLKDGRCVFTVTKASDDEAKKLLTIQQRAGVEISDYLVQNTHTQYDMSKLAMQKLVNRVPWGKRFGPRRLIPRDDLVIGTSSVNAGTFHSVPESSSEEEEDSDDESSLNALAQLKNELRKSKIDPGSATHEAIREGDSDDDFHFEADEIVHKKLNADNNSDSEDEAWLQRVSTKSVNAPDQVSTAVSNRKPTPTTLNNDSAHVATVEEDSDSDKDWLEQISSQTQQLKQASKTGVSRRNNTSESIVKSTPTLATRASPNVNVTSRRKSPPEQLEDDSDEEWLEKMSSQTKQIRSDDKAVASPKTVTKRKRKRSQRPDGTMASAEHRRRRPKRRTLVESEEEHRHPGSKLPSKDQSKGKDVDSSVRPNTHDDASAARGKRPRSKSASSKESEDEDEAWLTRMKRFVDTNKSLMSPPEEDSSDEEDAAWLRRLNALSTAVAIQSTTDESSSWLLGLNDTIPKTT